jgi:hypothetical protein
VKRLCGHQVALDRAVEHCVVGQQHRPHARVLEHVPDIGDHRIGGQRLRLGNHYLANRHPERSILRYPTIAHVRHPRE